MARHLPPAPIYLKRRWWSWSSLLISRAPTLEVTSLGKREEPATWFYSYGKTRTSTTQHLCFYTNGRKLKCSRYIFPTDLFIHKATSGTRMHHNKDCQHNWQCSASSMIYDLMNDFLVGKFAENMDHLECCLHVNDNTIIQLWWLWWQW